MLRRHCRRIAAVARLLLRLWLHWLLLLWQASALRGVECFHCMVLSVCFFFLSPFLLLCLFGQALGPFGPVVIASLFGCSSGCSPRSSTASRRPQVWSAVHRSTKRFSTTSCVYSTHHSHRELISFPSSLLQRIPLALSSISYSPSRPPLGLNFSVSFSPLLLSLSLSCLSFSLPPSSHFSLPLLLRSLLFLRLSSSSSSLLSRPSSSPLFSSSCSSRS